MAMMRTTTPGSLTGSLSASGTMSANITVGTVNMAAADMTNYYDKEEVDGLLEGKADVDHDHYVKIGMMEHNIQEAYDSLMESKTDAYQVNTLISNYAAPIEHNHDDRYANSVVLAAKLDEKANKEHTHDYSTLENLPDLDTYESKKSIKYPDVNDYYIEGESIAYLSITQDTKITLPTDLSSTDAREITLFLDVIENVIVTFHNVALWQSEPVIEAGTVCELIFTWSGSQWLGGCIVYGTQL